MIVPDGTLFIVTLNEMNKDEPLGIEPLHMMELLMLS